MAVAPAALLRRLNRSAGTWDPALRDAFRRYASSRSRLRFGARGGPHPYWLVFPDAVAGMHRRTGMADNAFLRDVLYGQSCLFLAVKIHDDVFDGHTQDRSLMFAADHLLLDAHEAFEHHFARGSPFWDTYLSSLRRTLNAIVATDQRQIHRFGSVKSVRALAREGYAVCTLGVYAVCLKQRRMRLFSAIRRCTEELAFVGQLLDDLEDMQEDMKRGRENYAMQVLSGGPAGGAKWFAMLRQSLQRAQALAARSGLPAIERHVSLYGKAVNSAEDACNRTLARLAFQRMGVRTD
jgi:hypothetical protein